jgi:tetratricopeptide (TPR) repeat protein
MEIQAIWMMNDAEYDGPLRVTVSLLLAQSYWEQGRYSDAALTLVSVRENVQSVSSGSDIVLTSLTDDILHAEGQFLCVRGLFFEAENHLQAVLSGRSQYLASGHPKVAEVELELAVIAVQKCEFSVAVQYFDLALNKLSSAFAIAGGDEGFRLLHQAQRLHESSNGTNHMASATDDDSAFSAGSHYIDRTNSPSLENTILTLQQAKGQESGVSSQETSHVFESCVENLESEALYQYLAGKHPVVATAVYQKAVFQCTLGQYMPAERNMVAVLNGRKKLLTRTQTQVQATAYLELQHEIQSQARQGLQMSHAQMIQLHTRDLLAPNRGNHPDIAQAMFGLAEVLRCMFIVKESLDLHERALAMRRACGKTELHVEIAESIFAIGQTFLSAGNISQALVAFEHSLALWNDLMVTFDVAVHLSNEVNKVWLGYVYALLNRFDDGQIMLGESGKRICNIVGNQHVRVAEGNRPPIISFNGIMWLTVGLCALGELMMLKARYADAKKLLVRASEMFCRLFISTHSEVARVKCLLAENCRLPGNFNGASDFCTESLNVRLHIFGSKNLCFAFGLHNRAQLLRDIDNLEEAERLYSSALKIVKSNVGEESTFFALILGDVGECLRKLGHLENARIVLTKAVELKRRVFGEHNICVYESLIAQTLVDMDVNDVTNYQNALYVLNEVVLPNLVPTIGTNHPLVHYVKANIGLCMNAIAILFLESGMYARLEAMVGPGHPLLLRIRTKEVDQIEDDKPLDAAELPGQVYIDNAILEWEKYPQTPFSAMHPWLKRFGV